MAEKKKPTEVKKARQDWLLTYSDMVTLLLVFFIAIISTGETTIVKTRVILSTFNGNIGLLNGGKTLESEDSFVSFGKSVESLPSEKSARSLDAKERKKNALFAQFIESKRIRLVENEDGIVISLFSDILFDEDSAEVKYPFIREILNNINILLTSDNFNGKILIEGHTDNTPYRGTEYRDKWDLSMERALSVFHVMRSYPFIKPLREDRISIHGYGSTRPIEDNDSPIQRAYNRRVDIVLKRK